LFTEICRQPEYALCRTERALMTSRLDAIAGTIGKVDSIIEPGAGDCGKIRCLIDALKPARIVVMDIAQGALAVAAQRMSDDYPDLDVTAMGMDFLEDLEAATPHLPPGKRLVYYPGSSIGNFSPGEATLLLSRFKRLAGAGGRLLIGFDMKKDPDQLHRAYNDAAGVTAAFNLNLLVRLNRELNADFVPAGFRHYAFYNPVEGRVEMHLISLASQDVQVSDRRFHFEAGETLHTENSYKYLPAEFCTMAGNAGWRLSGEWVHEGFAVQMYE